MIYYAITAALVSTLAFGLVLYVQICRIDELKRRCNELASDRLVHDNRLKLQRELISENCKHSFAIEAKLNDLERARGTANANQPRFEPGEPHPFAADAYVSADEVLA